MRMWKDDRLPPFNNLFTLDEKSDKTYKMDDGDIFMILKRARSQFILLNMTKGVVGFKASNVVKSRSVKLS